MSASYLAKSALLPLLLGLGSLGGCADILCSARTDEAVADGWQEHNQCVRQAEDNLRRHQQEQQRQQDTATRQALQEALAQHK